MKEKVLANADRSDSTVDPLENQVFRSPLKGFKRSFTVFPEIGGDSRQFLTFFQERRGVDQCKAWLIFIVGFLVDTLCLGVLSSYGVFYIKFRDEFPENSRYVLAGIGSSALSVVLLASPIVCVLNHRRGQWPLVLLGGVAASGALLLSSYLTEATHFFLSYSLLYGLSACLIYSPSTLISNTCFLRFRPVISGFFLAASCSGVLVVLPVTHLLVKLYGWRIVFRMLAGALMLSSLSAVTYSWMKQFYAVDQKSDPDELQWEGNTTFTEMIRLFRRKRFLLWLFVSGTYAFIHFIPYINLIEFGLDSGLSKDKAAVLVMFIAISGLPTRLVVCRALDVHWLNKKLLYMVAMMGCGISLACMPLVNSYTFLMALVLLWGILEGFVMVLAPAVTVQVMGWQHAPAAWNVMHWVHAAPIAFGPIAAAWYRDTADSYHTIFHVFGGFVTIVSVFVSAIPSSDTVVHHTDSWPHVPPHDAIYRRIEGQGQTQHGPGGEAPPSMMHWQPSSVVETAVGPFLTNPSVSEPRIQSPRSIIPPATLVLPGAMYVQASTHMTSSSGTSDDTGGWEPSALMSSILGGNGGAGEGFSSSRYHLALQTASSSYEAFHTSNIGGPSTSRAGVFTTSSRPTIGEAGDRVPFMPVAVDVIGSSSGQDDDNDNAILFASSRATAGPSSSSSRRISLHHMQGGDLYAMQKTAEGNANEENVYSGLMDDEGPGMITGVEHSSSIEVMPVDEAGDAIRRYPMTPPPPAPTGAQYREFVRLRAQTHEHRVQVAHKSSSTSRGMTDESSSRSIESIRLGMVMSQESSAPLLGDNGDSVKRAGGGGESQESLQYVTPPTSMLSLVKSKSAAPEQLMSGRRRDRNHFEGEQAKLSLKRRVWSAGGIERHLARSAKSVLNPCAEPQPACFNAASSTRVSPGETKCIIESVESEDETSTDDGITVPPYVGHNTAEQLRKFQSLQATLNANHTPHNSHTKSDETYLKGRKSDTSENAVKERAEEWSEDRKALSPPPTEGRANSVARDSAYSWVAAAAELVAAAVKGVSHTDSSKKGAKTPETSGAIGGAGECLIHCTPVKSSSKESSQSWSSAAEDIEDETISYPRAEKRKIDSSPSQSQKKMAIMREFIQPKGSRSRREPAGQENLHRENILVTEPNTPDSAISSTVSSSNESKSNNSNCKRKSASPVRHVAGLVHTVALAAAALVRGTPSAKETMPLLDSVTPSPPTQNQHPPDTHGISVKPRLSPLRPKPTVIAVQEARQRLLDTNNQNDSVDWTPSSSSGMTSPGTECDINKCPHDASGETSAGSGQVPNKTFPLDILSILNLLEMVDENIVHVAESVFASITEMGSTSPPQPVAPKLVESTPLLRASLKLAGSHKSASATSSCTAIPIMMRKKPGTVPNLSTNTQTEIGGDGDLPRGIIMVAPTTMDTLDDLDQLLDHDDGRQSGDSLSSSSDDVPDETQNKGNATNTTLVLQHEAESEASVDSAFTEPRYKSSKLPLVNRQLTHLVGKREVHSAGALRLHKGHYLYSGDSTVTHNNLPNPQNNGRGELLATSARSKSLDALLWLMSTKTAVVNTASLKKEIASAVDQKEVLNLLRQNSSTLSVASHESTATIKANSQSSRSSPAGVSISSQLVCKADDYIHMSTDQHSTINLINFSSTSSEDGEMEKDVDKGSQTDGSTISSSQLHTVSSTEESCLRVFSPTRMIPITVESEAGSPLTLSSNSSSTAVIDTRRRNFARSTTLRDTEDGVIQPKPKSDKSMAPFLNPSLSSEMLENPEQLEETELAWWPFSLFIPEARGTAFANVDLQSLVKCYPFFGDIGGMKPEDIANVLLKANDKVGEGSDVKVERQTGHNNTQETKDGVLPNRLASRCSSLGRRRSVTNSRDGATGDDITWVSSFDEMTDSSCGEEAASDLSSVSEGRTGGSSGGSHSGNSPQKMRRRKRRKKLAKQTSGW